jgi:hypothetical protein
MIDAFVVLAPLWILGIVALLGFVGCNWVYGVEPVKLEINLDHLNPNFGPAAGGTQVQLVGSNLIDVDKVTFAGIDALSFTVLSESEIDATCPPNPPGPADVIVTRSTGDDSGSSNPQAFNYVAIGFVQTASNAVGGGAALSVSLPNSTIAGNLLIAAVSYGGPATGTVTIQDNLGNAFTLTGKGPWFRQSAVYFLPNIPGGSVTVNAVGTNGATGPWSICVSEYSGADPTSAAIYGFSTVFSPSAGTPGVETIKGVAVTPTNPGDIVYVVVFAAQPTSLVPGPVFAPHLSTTTSVLTEDIATPITVGQTVATDDTTGGAFVPWVALAVAIKA